MALAGVGGVVGGVKHVVCVGGESLNRNEVNSSIYRKVDVDRE